MSQGFPSAPTGATADDDRLTTVFRLLSRPRRRRALYLLRKSDGPVPVERLVERLAARETGDDGSGVPSYDGGNETTRGGSETTSAGGADRSDDDPSDGNRDDPARERLETALRHVHLPKLTAGGAVERGPDGAVRYAAGDALDGWVARAAAAEGW